MSSLSEQDPLNPNDPEFYAPPRLRERAAKLGLSLSQEARLDPIRSSPLSLPASLENQDAFASFAQLPCDRRAARA